MINFFACDISELTAKEKLDREIKGEENKRCSYMELKIKEPRDIEELRKAIENIDSVPENISIRIENNILTIDGNWLLRRKDGKLENNMQNLMKKNLTNIFYMGWKIDTTY